MELGMIGLGKMGAFMTERLVEAGHSVVGFDVDPDAVQRVVAVGASGAGSIRELVDQLYPPRVVWIMVPAGDPVDETIERLLPDLDDDDVIIDGGNSYYRDTMRRAELCVAGGCHLVDVGTSGGVWGLTEGYSLMVGGTDEAVEILRPVLETLAPRPDQGWGHVGPSGAGHFVKMIHNGIEYGMMQAYAEGFALLKARDDFSLDLAEIAETWRHGSVVRSWLLDLTASFLAEDQGLANIEPFVADSGEGRWTAIEAIEQGIPTPVMSTALMMRFASQGQQDYTAKLLAMMRKGFGGHALKQRDQ